MVDLASRSRAMPVERRAIVAILVAVGLWSASSLFVRAGHSDALAWFDVGYLAETYKQWIGQSWMRVSNDEQNPAAGVDGYALVKKAIGLRGSDPQMEFAAALITLSGPAEEHRRHALNAIAGARIDPLLAQNLAMRFAGPQSQTMSEMLAKNSAPN